MSWYLKLYTFFFGHLAGTDEFGNKYYQSTTGKRWVIYKGNSEASKVPAQWHIWLHSYGDMPKDGKKNNWQKPHQPNLTGTPLAYYPSTKTESTKRDYEPWHP